MQIHAPSLSLHAPMDNTLLTFPAVGMAMLQSHFGAEQGQHGQHVEVRSRRLPVHVSSGFFARWKVK